MTKWNPMQEKAIYTKHKNILVSASAGSGKTTVLIARLLHLVQDEKMDVNRILAMTFSEAAANEMKKRLAIALKEAIQKSDNQQEKEYLQTQLATLGSAYISTIHGFCLQIIQKYYYIISLDKERVNNVMDDANKTIIMDMCMKETLQHYEATNENFHTLCNIFSARSESDEALQEALLSLFYLAQSKSDPHAFLQACRKQENITTIAAIEQPILSYFYDYLIVQVQSMLETIQDAMMSYTDIDKVEEVKKKKDDLQVALSHLEKQAYSSFREIFLSQCLILIPTEKDNEVVKIKKKELEELEGQVLAIAYEEEDYVTRHNENISRITLFVDVCIDFLTRYEKKKEEYKYIDFSDMEHLALTILQANDGFVANAYREQFLEIMVDEFQDSNDVQDFLVKCICRENNVFRVGDIKQSIYGFRHASPAIMKGLIDNKGEHDEVLYLSNNYRSKKSIIDFNNALFQDLMNVKGFPKAFSPDDYAYHGVASQEENNSAICFHNLDKEFVKESTYNKDQLKAKYIASQIVALHKEKGYAFKDFVVLVKAHAKSAFLKEAFEELQIPHFISIKHGFYHSRAVQSVISFLKALHNPNDNIAMCATLLSSFFQYDDIAIADAKLHMEKGQSFYSYFKDNILIFEQLRAQIHTMKMSQLLMEIYQIQDFYEKETTTQEKSNLDKLFEMVSEQEKKTHLTLASFLDVLEKTQDTQIGEAIPIGNQDDVVQVMSIHQSKGLQFPVVFLYSTSSISLLDTRGIIAFDDTLHIGLQYFDASQRLVYPTIERIAINHKITKSQLEEEMRVLYVATTRAQQEMHIVDAGIDMDLPALNQVEVYKKRGYSAWITQSLRHQAFKDIRFLQQDSDWETPPLSKKETQTTTLSYYAYDKEAIETSSPSESEWVNFTPREYNPYETIAMERGNTLHKMIEILPKEHVTLALLDSYPLAKDISSQDKEGILAFYESSLYQTCLQGEIHHEYPFMVKKDGLLIHGYIDFLSILENEVILIDFKSDRNIEKKELLNRYQAQLRAYQDALGILYPNKTISPYIYSFSLQEMIAV